MSTTNFEVLCRGLCDLAGTPMPDLTPDDATGNVAIHITLDQVDVVVSHEPVCSPDHAKFSVTFGALPPGRELDACKVLMRMNVYGSASRSAFGRNPATGEVVLIQVLAQEQAAASDVYQRIVQLVETAKGWRQHHFLN